VAIVGVETFYGRNVGSHRVIDALAEKLPAAADHLEQARPDILAFTAFPRAIWRQSSAPIEPPAPVTITISPLR
jgi:hypothetical protein